MFGRGKRGREFIETKGGGGCSYYIYAWAQKYYPDHTS